MRSLNILQLLQKIVPEIWWLYSFYLCFSINSSHFSMNFDKFFIFHVRKSCKQIHCETRLQTMLLHIQTLISLRATEMPLIHLALWQKSAFSHWLRGKFCAIFANQCRLFDIYFQRKSKIFYWPGHFDNHTYTNAIEIIPFRFKSSSNDFTFP